MVNGATHPNQFLSMSAYAPTTDVKSESEVIPCDGAVPD
jgi:hypothetical protein